MRGRHAKALKTHTIQDADPPSHSCGVVGRRDAKKKLDIVCYAQGSLIKFLATLKVIKLKFI